MLAKWQSATIGTIALQQVGKAARLRSLCVVPEYRGHAVGTRLLSAIEERAAGGEEHWLSERDASDRDPGKGATELRRDSTTCQGPSARGLACRQPSARYSLDAFPVRATESATSVVMRTRF